MMTKFSDFRKTRAQFLERTRAQLMFANLKDSRQKHFQVLGEFDLEGIMF